MAAFHPARSGDRSRAPRISRPTDKLSGAHPHEIDWPHVAPILRIAFRVPFVYFIGEEDDGPIKVGHAKDPIRRLRALQTGNPRRLRIERLILGDATIERALHEYWRPHAITGKPRGSAINARYEMETEWFQASARDEILHAGELIARGQLQCIEEEGDPYYVAFDVMTELGYAVARGDTIRMLARTVGYVERSLRP